ncbi:MAG: beta-aspartyl-peptidase [Duodenibacillus sp.]|nr:beta-aspartyl-peptidase [Duodenibacillus sp.]
MALLIKNARVFSPDDLGVKDVLIVNKQIAAVGENLTVTMPELEVLDAKGLTMTPGFIDQHIHITGGGGEGGPKTRTPELVLSELIECGTTSVVGVSGTDATTRSIPNLLAKVRALQSEGVSAWMYTSNYEFPPTTLTDSVKNDLFFVPEVVGVKIAMGDHRSSFPTLEEVSRLLCQIRVGAMIAGKLGVLHIHLGNIVGPFDTFLEIVKRGMPIQHIRPTHCARDVKVFEGAIRFGLAGGNVDITTGGSCAFASPAHAVVEAIKAGVPVDKLTMSSDGHGSVPRFNEKGEMIGLGVGGVACNLRDVKRLIGELGVDPATAFALVSRNVAKALRFDTKGEIAAGKCADINLFDENMNLVHVFAKGKAMMKDGVVVTKGTFEI